MAIPQATKRYIKVETPLTTDGKTLAYDEDRQVKMRVAFLPITAKKELLRNTSKLPEYLRPTITELSGDASVQAEVTQQQNADKQEIRDEALGGQTGAVRPARQRNSGTRSRTRTPKTEQ